MCGRETLRMDARLYRDELDRSPTLNLVMLRYATRSSTRWRNRRLRSSAQSGQRCCRWLLMTRDRMPSGDFLLTQEFRE